MDEKRKEGYYRMDFSDKLNFLMKITQTMNKDLADGISVDRSLISLLRTGKRGMPRNREHISRMADYFARHCTADFQRHALSEMLGQTVLRSSMPTDFLAGYLERWLANEPELNMTEFVFLEEDPSKPAEAPPVPDLPAASSSTGSDSTTFYYGNEGKRNAMHRLLSVIRDISEPCTIYHASEDNLEWLLEDYSFIKEFQSAMIENVNRGFHICQILPSVNYMNRYVESLRFWLPIYTTGQAEVYYYPRLRDNLYRYSAIVLPGHCALTSVSIGLEHDHIVCFSKDPTFVDKTFNQFQDYLSLCLPAMTLHNSPEEYYTYFQKLFQNTGDYIQKVFPLSANTLPKELLQQLTETVDHPGWKNTFQMYLDEVPHFEEQLLHNEFFDICELASAADVRAGKVPIGCPYKTYEGHPVYTLETYVLHLKNILRLMDRYDNYHFIPYTYKEARHDYSLFVNSSAPSLLVRNLPPAMMFEIKRPEMVMAFREHLLRMAENLGYGGMHQTKTRMKILSCIRELQESDK